MTEIEKTIFLTGATGVMGWNGFVRLINEDALWHIVVLVRPSRKNKKLMRPYRHHPAVRIVWGNLLNYEDVLKCVTGADYVLHVGGMVSPKADHFPQLTMKVNITAAENIVKAVKQQPNAQNIKVVYIGSVAQEGDCNPPFHWASTGCSMNPNKGDYYALSKIFAERIFADSGLANWVCLRQSGIIHPGLLKTAMDPITFDVPLNGVLEWCTVEDAGRLLVCICRDSVSKEFWNRFYNISSGPAFRLTNYQFEEMLLNALGFPSPKKIFEPQWFAANHFHGHWYLDADVLDEYLHFRRNIFPVMYFKQFAKQVPKYYRLLSKIPAPIIKMFMKGIARRSKEKGGDRLQSWDQLAFQDKRPPENVPFFDRITMDFRVVEWRCNAGHTFMASPNLVYNGGHWCPQCALNQVKDK